jgi:hypothetical protein
MAQYCIDGSDIRNSITSINTFMNLTHLKLVLSDLASLRTGTDFVIVLGLATLFVGNVLIPMIDALTN